jgi:hypothetical protein
MKTARKSLEKRKQSKKLIRVTIYLRLNLPESRRLSRKLLNKEKDLPNTITYSRKGKSTPIVNKRQSKLHRNRRPMIKI